MILKCFAKIVVLFPLVWVRWRSYPELQTRLVGCSSTNLLSCMLCVLVKKKTITIIITLFFLSRKCHGQSVRSLYISKGQRPFVNVKNIQLFCQLTVARMTKALRVEGVAQYWQFRPCDVAPQLPVTRLLFWFIGCSWAVHSHWSWGEKALSSCTACQVFPCQIFIEAETLDGHHQTYSSLHNKPGQRHQDSAAVQRSELDMEWVH